MKYISQMLDVQLKTHNVGMINTCMDPARDVSFCDFCRRMCYFGDIHLGIQNKTKHIGARDSHPRKALF